MDRYARFVLSIIAVLLAVIALRPIFQPLPVAAQRIAAGSLNGVVFVGDPEHNGFWAIDTKDGQIYRYSGNNVTERWKIARLGEQLQNQ